MRAPKAQSTVAPGIARGVREGKKRRLKACLTMPGCLFDKYGTIANYICMHRTTILLPENLKRDAERRARKAFPSPS